MAKQPYTQKQQAVTVLGLVIVVCGLWQTHPGLGVTALGFVTIFVARHLK